MQRILPERKTSKNGQVVLIVLLIMSVILVVGLSIASRSVTDIKISQQSQEAARALWVAQAGLEEAIKLNQSIGAGEKQPLGGVEYSVSKVGIGGANEFVFPGNFGPDEPAVLWLVEHNASTKEIDDSVYYTGSKLTFYWGDKSACDANSPALEATLVYKDSGNKFQNKRYVYDHCSSGRTQNFSDSNIDCSFGGKNFAFCSSAETLNLPVGSKPYLVRLKLLFNNTPQPVGVGGDANFPGQGDCYESSATVAESGVTRKLRQCQLWGTTPSIFDNVLFSGNSLPTD